MERSSVLAAPLDQCQQRLAKLWFTWSGLVLALVFLQTIFGHFEGRETSTWKWLATNLGPPLAVMLGAVAGKAFTKNSKKKLMVSLFAYRLSLWISIFYLSLITLTLLLEPVAMMAAKRADLNLVKNSELWLIPLQTLLTGSLGAFGASKIDT